MNINYGPISFAANLVNVFFSIMLSVMFIGGWNLLEVFVMNKDASFLWLFFGMAICYISGGYLFWLFGRTMYVFRNELTIKNPLWFKNFRFYGNEVTEYGILVEKTDKGEFISWRIVLKDRKPADLVPFFHADFDVLIQFLEDNHVKYTQTIPFHEDLEKRRTLKKKIDEYQIVAAVILFFIIGAWWLKLSLQL